MDLPLPWPVAGQLMTGLPFRPKAASLAAMAFSPGAWPGTP
jgi:hypothetical protein